MRSLATLGILLVGCGYRTGSFDWPSYRFGAARATIGCVDVAVEQRAISEARGAVLSYAFGNGCDHPAIIDLAAARVVGRDASGQRVALAPYDPDRVIRAAMLDGRTVGHEAIAYAADIDVHDVCIDLATIAHGEGERWVCVTPSKAEEVQ
jgi:hypothetical protein